MRSLARRSGLTAAIILLVAAAPASAETFKTQFGAGAPDKFAWEGNVYGAPSFSVGVTGFKNGCFDFAPLFRCDHVVFNVKEPGELTASATMDEEPLCDPAGFACTVDIDLFLYKSDAEGVRADDAEPIAEAATFDQTETLKIKVQPGFYALEIEPYNGQDVPYKGDASFVSSVPPPAPAPAPAPAAAAAPEPQPEPAPAPAGTTEPQSQPQSQPAASSPPPPAAKRTGKRAACTKKAKKIRKAKKRKRALKKCRKKPV